MLQSLYKYIDYSFFYQLEDMLYITRIYVGGKQYKKLDIKYTLRVILLLEETHNLNVLMTKGKG